MNKFDDLALEMAELSCKLAQACHIKELYFASKFKLTPAEFKFLKLFHINSSLPIKEIASNLNITAGRITHILTSLEKKGFVIRKNDPIDKRNVIVSLTPKCEPFLKNLGQSHIQLHKDILARIPEKSREVVINSMKELIRVIKLSVEEENIKF